MLLELHGIGKPANRVAERVDREPDQHVAAGGGIVVDEQAFAVLPDLDAEADKVALGAVDASSFQFGLEQDVSGVEIGQADVPGMIALRHRDPAAVIEIVAQAFGAFLGRNIRRRPIGACALRRSSLRRRRLRDERPDIHRQAGCRAGVLVSRLHQATRPGALAGAAANSGVSA